MEESKVVGTASCLTVILILIFNLAIGGWSVNEILSWFGKDIPTFFDVVIGLFLGEVTVPVAIIGKILLAFGVF